MFISTKERLSRAYSIAFFTLALTLFIAHPAPAQGCAQCRESIGQTPARTQQAYRRGITVLVIAASGICLATLTVIRRFGKNNSS